MNLELRPSDPAARDVLDVALATGLVDPLHAAASRSSSGWLSAGLLEGVDRDPRADGCYALSPRSTRGATRA